MGWGVLQDIKSYIAPSRAICKSCAGVINNPSYQKTGSNQCPCKLEEVCFPASEVVRATVVVLMLLMGDSMLISQIN